jgi:outer membrane murein-binding lipoprotein Lpp
LLQSRIVELSKQVDQISTDFSKLRSDIESRVERESRET